MLLHRGGLHRTHGGGAPAVAAGPADGYLVWHDPAGSLYVDGDARPLRVFAGAYGASPPRIPFSLCP